MRRRRTSCTPTSTATSATRRRAASPSDVPGTGTGRCPGWDPAYEWDSSYVPFDALPNVLDPKDGYVVTANQAVVSPRYPYYLGDSFDYGYRAQRIRDSARDDAEADRRRHGDASSSTRSAVLPRRWCRC